MTLGPAALPPSTERPARRRLSSASLSTLADAITEGLAFGDAPATVGLCAALEPREAYDPVEAAEAAPT